MNESQSPSRPRRLRRILLTLFLVLVVVLAGAGIWFWSQLRGSLPILEGEVSLAGLESPVEITRDELGVPTIQAASRLDAARALGFLHGQDRFFQMDLIRRQAAGELSELVGGGALGFDRRQRMHRFRARAQGILDSLPVEERALVDAYVAGVNAGLGALDAPPFEYLVLRADPVPWRVEDTLLAVFAMYTDLQGGGASRERSLGVLHDTLPPALYRFVVTPGSEWDSPMVGEAFGNPPLPSEEDLLRSAEELEEIEETEEAEETEEPVELDAVADLGAAGFPGYFGHPEAVALGVLGSNNWAIAGSRTAHGGAMVANDMHLGHAVPNIWYRASMEFSDASGTPRRITGVSLPGAMLVVAGSTDHVAWGFTNSQGDWTDLVVIEPVPGDENSYLTPEGPRAFEVHEEVLKVKGGEDEVLEVRETIWGPVWGEDHMGRLQAIRWVAHSPRAVNLALRHMETAESLEEMVAIAHRAGIPAQNGALADHTGRVGWTFIGPIPRRFGHDGWLPVSWADGTKGWDGWLSSEEIPKVIDPEDGQIFTANQRLVSDEWLALVGDGGYDLGARGGQIRDGLSALSNVQEADLLAVQLDDRALFLERWRELLVQVLEDAPEDPLRQEMLASLEDWNGKASVDSVAYRLVRAFRLRAINLVLEHLSAPAEEAYERFSTSWVPYPEGPVWVLLEERPDYLLDPKYDSWDALLLEAADWVAGQLTEGERDLASRPWGDRNTLRVQHPLAMAVPALGRFLNMPPQPAPGDSHMPRVQGPSFGASERFVVSPGRQEEGIFHMPTGQSGHPLSAHYGDGHSAWVEGEPTPFLPGPAVNTLRLVP